MSLDILSLLLFLLFLLFLVFVVVLVSFVVSCAITSVPKTKLKPSARPRIFFIEISPKFNVELVELDFIFASGHEAVLNAKLNPFNAFSGGLETVKKPKDRLLTRAAQIRRGVFAAVSKAGSARSQRCAISFLASLASFVFGSSWTTFEKAFFASSLCFSLACASPSFM